MYRVKYLAKSKSRAPYKLLTRRNKISKSLHASRFLKKSTSVALNGDKRSYQRLLATTLLLTFSFSYKRISKTLLCILLYINVLCLCSLHRTWNLNLRILFKILQSIITLKRGFSFDRKMEGYVGSVDNANLTSLVSIFCPVQNLKQQLHIQL